MILNVSLPYFLFVMWMFVDLSMCFNEKLNFKLTQTNSLSNTKVCQSFLFQLQIFHPAEKCKSINQSETSERRKLVIVKQRKHVGQKS